GGGAAPEGGRSRSGVAVAATYSSIRSPSWIVGEKSDDHASESQVQAASAASPAGSAHSSGVSLRAPASRATPATIRSAIVLQPQLVASKPPGSAAGAATAAPPPPPARRPRRSRAGV